MHMSTPPSASTIFWKPTKLIIATPLNVMPGIRVSIAFTSRPTPRLRPSCESSPWPLLFWLPRPNDSVSLSVPPPNRLGGYAGTSTMVSRGREIRYALSWAALIWAMMIESVRMSAVEFCRSSMPSMRTLTAPSMFLPAAFISGGSRSSCVTELLAIDRNTRSPTTTKPLNTMRHAPMITITRYLRGSFGRTAVRSSGSSRRLRPLPLEPLPFDRPPPDP